MTSNSVIVITVNSVAFRILINTLPINKLWTARVETTTTRWISDAWWRTRKRFAFMIIIANTRDCPYKCPGVWMLWIIENVICISSFNDFTRIHDDNPVTDISNDIKIV
jgi:hypothetical protein